MSKKKQMSNMSIKQYFNNLLTEDKEGKNINAARKYLKAKGYSLEESQKILDGIRSSIPNSRVADCKFLLGVTRMYIKGELRDVRNIFKLNRILPYIGVQTHIDEYDRNLNDLSIDALVDKFSGIARQDAEKSRTESYGNKYIRNKEYTIVRIPNFEEAEKYNKYVSWCITQEASAYKNYTDEGLGLFYFCLKNGFEQIPEAKGENCPLDEYGLSMIAVSVTEDGEPNTITCRWNHDNGGDDKIMSKKQLEDLLGVNFYETFKPYSKEEIKLRNERITKLFKEANNKLKQGVPLNQIFEDVKKLSNNLSLVKLDGIYSILNDQNQLIGNGELWFNKIKEIGEGLIAVNWQRKWTIVNGEGVLFKVWFDSINDFSEGFSVVCLNGEYSFINTKGELISNGRLWFDEVQEFIWGFAPVCINNKWSFINYTGKLIGDGHSWFDDVYNFHDDWACVINNDKWSYINTNGELIGDGNLWFDEADDFNEGMATVRVNDTDYSIDEHGNFYDDDTQQPIPNPLKENRRTRKTIIVNESMLKMGILTENRESKNINLARKYLKAKGYSLEDAQEILDVIRSSMPNARVADCKFLLGITRMYLKGELTDGASISRLNRVLPYIGSDAHVNEYQHDLNGMSLEELVERFSGVVQQDAERSRAESNATKHIKNNNYTIVRIPNFEEAEKYGKYTAWCVTQKQKSYNQYTNDGLGLFYFCLMDGFEKKPKRKGKNCPLDKYGLSMIAVSVTEDGEPNTITCRWNHTNGGNDNIMTKGQLEDLLGVNFYEIFKPYSEEEIVQKKEELIRPFIEAKEKLEQGVSPKDVFDKVYDAKEGFLLVKLNDKESFIDSKGELIGNGKLWFDDGGKFQEGFAKVRLNDKWSLLNSKGELIEAGGLWFDELSDFKDGVARANLNNKWTLITSKGELIGNGKLWFDWVSMFFDGFAVVRIDGKGCSLINTKGELIGNGKLWFDKAYGFINGFAQVCMNNKWSFINTKGELIGNGKLWFDYVSSFYNGFAQVRLNNDWSFVNTKGELIGNGELWFDGVKDFENGFACVEVNRLRYYIDADGNFYYYYTKQPIPSPIKENKRKRKTIIVSESMFKRRLLTEDKEGKNINYARKYLKEKGYSLERSKEILDAIRSSIPNSRVADCKFLLGITRMYLNMDLMNPRNIFNLNMVLPYIGSNPHVSEYNNNLNNESLETLVNRFSGLAKQDAEKSRLASYANQRIKNNDYTIVRIPSFKEASKYSKYTSWCVTQNKMSYKQYTNDGLGLFYFCLRDGFEQIPEIEGKNCPLDEYGLSMISVSVTEGGEPNTITSRWNHDNGGNDKVMTKDQLEDLLGVNFYETFKPYSKEDIEMRKADLMRPFIEANKELKQGKSPERVFEDVFDEVDGFRIVELNDKYSFINNNNKLIGDGYLWFDTARNFSEGFAAISLEEKGYSYINTQGELVKNGDLWFEWADDFRKGLAPVCLNRKYSYIDTNFELVKNGELWFDYTTHFSNGLAQVRLGNKWSYINMDFELIGDGNLWFDNLGPFENGWAIVGDDNKFSFVDNNGHLIGNGKLWFDSVKVINNELYFVRRKGKWSVLNSQHQLLWNGKLWFDHIQPFFGEDNLYMAVIAPATPYLFDKEGNFYDFDTTEPIPEPVLENKSNKKIIIVSESAFSRGLLSENRESKNINLARKYLKEKGYSLDKAQEILDAIRSSVPNARIADCKFLLGTTRLYLNGELKDGESISSLNRVLPYIGSDAHVDEYKPNLNDLSLEELVKRFSVIAQQDADKSRSDSYAKEHVRNNEYTIVRVPSYKVAKEYGRYTSWCVTHSKDMYRQYTNDNFGLFYFCLKNGFESIKEVEGENCPLDEYGLSMIAVSITEDGDPNTITCRWNHDNGGNDKIMSKDQLEDLLGVNFYEVFKPYSKEEIAKKKDELMRPFRRANERLKKGESLNSIFEWVDPQPNGCTIVKLKNKYSYVNSNNELIKNGELWFDYVDKFVDGFAPVTLANKSSLLDTNFDLIGDGNVWFDCVDYFRNGFSKVYDANKGWSFINTKGELIGDLWFTLVRPFSEGFATVLSKSNGWSFINTKGELIMDGKAWFKKAHSFSNGLASVYLGNKGWTFVNTKGKFIGNGKLWFDDADGFNEGWASVELDGKKTFINTKGEFIGNGKLWFDDTDMFNEGFARVELNDKGYSFLNTKGEFIKDGKLWFSDASNFINGLAVGHVRGVGYLVINTKEEVIRGGKFGFINAQNSQDGLYVSLFIDNEIKVYKMDKDFNFYDAQTNEPVPSPIKENKARRKTIIVNEGMIKRTLLTENREGKNINLARKYLIQQGYSLDEAQEMLDEIRSSIPNSRIASCKFLLGIVRLYLNGELKDGASISSLNRVLPYIGSDAHVNEYSYDLNVLSLDELVSRFSGLAKQDAEKSRAASNATKHVKNEDYAIIRIPNFEEAEKYGGYTTWCVTHSVNMYNQYTNDGLGLFYFCLKNGFEEIPEIEGKNCPLDEYGLSMIAVSVTEDGEPNTITCRWNHDNGGNDNIMSKDQLEELLGVNFYETFKPYSEEEIAQKNEELIRAFREAKERLKKGEPLRSIFSRVDASSEGFSMVGLKGKYSFVDSNHELIGDGELWFDSAYGYHEGFARVRLNDKWSFLNTKGELIGDGELWFDECERFKGGLAAVVLNNKYSFINAKGELIGDGELWFDGVYKFNEGFVRVRLRDKWSFINTQEGLIGNGKLWFDYADDFQDGLASINLGDKWSFINTKGELIGDGKLWFDVCDSFKGGFAKVKVNDKWSFINTKGELIGNGKLWFDDVEPFYNWFARVYTNRGRYALNKYAIDKDGNFYDYMTLQPISNPLKESKRNKKTIIVSESKLHNILLELDWKTYGNAMLKSKRLANSLPKNDINRYINDKRSKNFAFQFDNDLLKQYNLDPLEYDNAMTWISSNGDAGYEPDLNVLKRVKMVNKELDMLATNRYKYIKGKGWTNIDNL